MNAQATRNWASTLLVAVLLALLALIAPAVARNAGVPIPDNAAALAATGCSQQIYVYSGSSGGGYGRALCAEDYPLVRTPATGGSFDGGWSWPGCSSACTMDDTISSYAWASTTQPGIRMKFYESYYFNAGETLQVTRPSVGSGPYNIPSANNNQISSFAGCGTSCADSPG